MTPRPRSWRKGDTIGRADKATKGSARRPIGTLLDLLGRRWALRILWELRGTSLSSRRLAERCGGVSPSVLHRRLRELRAGKLVELQEKRGHALSPLGATLLETLRPLQHWADVWARRFEA